MKSKLLSLLITIVLFNHLSLSALTIYNNNTKSIRVEVMDCPSKLLYAFPSDWKFDHYNYNPILYIDYLHINHIYPEKQVHLDPITNPDMPSKVCLQITGWSSWLGGVITRVNSNCSMAINDGGFLQGIKAEYFANC